MSFADFKRNQTEGGTSTQPTQGGFSAFKQKAKQATANAPSLSERAAGNREKIIGNVQFQRQQTLIPEERERVVEETISPFVERARKQFPNVSRDRIGQATLAGLEVKEPPSNLDFGQSKAPRRSETTGLLTQLGAPATEVLIEDTLVGGLDLLKKEFTEGISILTDRAKKVAQSDTPLSELKKQLSTTASQTYGGFKGLVQEGFREFNEFGKFVTGRGEDDIAPIVSQRMLTTGETAEEARQALFGSPEPLKPTFQLIRDGAAEELKKRGASPSEQAVMPYVLGVLGTGLVGADIFYPDPSDFVSSRRLVQRATDSIDISDTRKILREEMPNVDDQVRESLAGPLTQTTSVKETRQVLDDFKATQTAVQKARQSNDAEAFRRSLADNEKSVIKDQMKSSEDEFFDLANQPARQARQTPTPETPANVSPELVEQARKAKSADEFVKAGVYSPARDSVARNQIRTAISQNTTLKNIDDLVENPQNPPIDKSTVNIRAEDIREGKRPYILIEDNQIIDGHHTYLAYKKEGVKEVPVVTKSQLTDLYNQVNAGARQTADLPELPKLRPQETAPVRPRGQASERLNMPTSKSPMDEKTIVQRRRAFVRDLRDRFGLTDSQLRKLSNNQDIRLMSNHGFKRFIDNMEQKAVEVAETRQAKMELMDLIEKKNFVREDQYRRAKQLPTIDNMTQEQLHQYAEALEQFQTGDVFMTQRHIEVMDRTDLKGARTMREVKERLVKSVEQETGQKLTIEELEKAVDFGAIDKQMNKMRSDVQLANTNPFLELVVKRVQAKQIDAQARFLEVQTKTNELARAANKSRKLGVTGKVKQFFIPKHTEIIRYLEAPINEKELYAKHLTPEELDYANYVSQYYTDAYNHLIKIKELYGSDYVNSYFTHTRKGFLEEWSDNGIINAVRNFWKTNKEDQAIASIIDQDTGDILAKSKFFRNTLNRTGEIDPSQNLTRVFLQYANLLETKKGLDAIIPEITVYTESLTPRDLTKKGLEKNRELKTFMNKYLNNKKGRRENFGGHVTQSGPLDIGLRLTNAFLGLWDLGGNLVAATAAVAGEIAMTYVSLGPVAMSKAVYRRTVDLGTRRLGLSKGKNILKEAEPFIGRNFWTEIMEADQQFGERAIKGTFAPFSQATVEMNKIHLLGSISKAEWKAGKLSPERLAEMRLDAGRWRDMGRDVKGIFGSTSVGQATTKYKGWAIPIVTTNYGNAISLSKKLKNKQFGEALTSRELKEFRRITELTIAVTFVGSYLLSEEEDETFIGQMKARAYQELLTVYGAMDPNLFTSVRLASFIDNLARNLWNVLQLEQYQRDSRWGYEGDLKGLRGFQRQFTPRIVEQFSDGSVVNSSEESSSGGGLPGLPKLPSTSGGGGGLPELPKLPKL